MLLSVWLWKTCNDRKRNGDPAPKRGFFKRVGDFLESAVLFVIGVGVIGGIIYVCRKK